MDIVNKTDYRTADIITLLNLVAKMTNHKIPSVIIRYYRPRAHKQWGNASIKDTSGILTIGLPDPSRVEGNSPLVLLASVEADGIKVPAASVKKWARRIVVKIGGYGWSWHFDRHLKENSITLPDIYHDWSEATPEQRRKNKKLDKLRADIVIAKARITNMEGRQASLEARITNDRETLVDVIKDRITQQATMDKKIAALAELEK